MNHPPRLRPLLALFSGLALSATPTFATIDDGNTAWDAGNLDAAASAYAAALQADPTSADAAVRLALSKFALLAFDSDLVAFAHTLGIELSGQSSDAASLQSDLRWESFPDSAWTYSAEGGVDNDDCIRSGRSRDLWGSIVSAEFEGPGTVAFHWRLDDPAPPREFGVISDYTASGVAAVDDRASGGLYIDSNSGSSSESLYIGPGTHRIFWSFYDPTDSADTGAALYVDHVTFTPDDPVTVTVTVTVITPPPATFAAGSLADGIDLDVPIHNDSTTDHAVFDDPTGADVQTLLRAQLVPKLQEIDSLLARYDASGPEYLTLDWSGADWLGGSVGAGVTRFDRADALILHGLIQAATGAILTLDQIDFSDFRPGSRAAGMRADLTFFDALLQEIPTVLAHRAGSTPPAAATALDAALAALRAAQPIVSARPVDHVADYFVRVDDAASLIANLDDALPPGQSVTAFTHSGEDNGVQVAAAPLFDGSFDFRSLLPAFSGNRIALASLAWPDSQVTTVPDPTFGGIVSGLDDRTITDGLASDGSGFWTFNAWEAYNASSDLATYAFVDPTETWQQQIGVYSYSNQFSVYAYGPLRPGVDDLTFTPEISLGDLSAGWTPVSASGLQLSYAPYFGYYDGGWSFNFDAYTPMPPRLFVHLAASPQTWPADLTGWTFQFERGWDDTETYWTFTGPETVEWSSSTSPDTFTTHAVQIVREGASRLTLIVAGQDAMYYRLVLDFDGSDHASGRYTQPSDPTAARADTAQYLRLVGAYNYELLINQDLDFEIRPAEKLIISVPANTPR